MLVVIAAAVEKSSRWAEEMKITTLKSRFEVISISLRGCSQLQGTLFKEVWLSNLDGLERGLSVH